jgi:hypothetical protein
VLIGEVSVKSKSILQFILGAAILVPIPYIFPLSTQAHNMCPTWGNKLDPTMQCQHTHFEGGVKPITPRTRSSSWVFDPSFYLRSYADLSKAFGTDRAAAERHWLSRGILEGRQGSPDFSTKCYLARYSDLQKAFGANFSKALDHYLNRGIIEARNGKC